ncbi:MAG: helix-turn-helix domain-containing protein [Thaumarchaeota archaeon]|nr:helix-turn-helix domain-containing protein [Nitrososphaerota archaeon]
MGSNQIHSDSIFGILSSNIRAEILKSLADDGPMTISQFLELYRHDNHKNDITIQGLSKHFKKLDKAWFVKKNKNGLFSVTPFGHAIRQQLFPFETLARYREHLNSHATDRLPKKFLQDIWVLGNSVTIGEKRRVLEKVRSVIGLADRYLKIAVTSYVPEMVPLIAKRVERSSLRVSYLFGKNVRVPKNRTHLLTKSGWWNLLSTGLVERKMVDEELAASILITEKHAMISFCKSNGTSDLDTAFYGNDVSFRKWCEGIFAHMWQNAGVFYENKL